MEKQIITLAFIFAVSLGLYAQENPTKNGQVLTKIVPYGIIYDFYSNGFCPYESMVSVSSSSSSEDVNTQINTHELKTDSICFYYDNQNRLIRMCTHKVPMNNEISINYMTKDKIKIKNKYINAYPQWSEKNVSYTRNKNHYLSECGKVTVDKKDRLVKIVKTFNNDYYSMTDSVTYTYNDNGDVDTVSGSDGSQNKFVYKDTLKTNCFGNTPQWICMLIPNIWLYSTNVDAVLLYSKGNGFDIRTNLTFNFNINDNEEFVTVEQRVDEKFLSIHHLYFKPIK